MSPLIARQGRERAWHFAHEMGANCEGGAESALHLAAKTVIERTGGITLPGLSVKQSITLPDGRHGSGEASMLEAWIDFTTIKTEVSYGTVIPDIVGTAGSMSYLIEVGVTHFVDQEKLTKLRGLGCPSVEIDLRHIDRESWDWVELEQVVIHGTEGKRWLFCPEQK
jgi:hypothetical protein